MNYNYHTYTKWPHILWGLLILILSGCVQNEMIEPTGEEIVSIPVEVSGFSFNQTRSIETQPYTANRVLVLPFKKIDENISTNDDSNFAPYFAAAREADLSSASTYITMLNLPAGSTYKILAVGCNAHDYDLNNPGSSGNTFDIGSLNNPTLLSNIHLLARSAAVVPEFFTAIGQSYYNGNSAGAYFKPEQINSIKINLTRLVSGLNIEIANVPDYITSITLVAEKLVKGVQPISGAATVVQASGDADNLKTFSTQLPVSGRVSFNHYILPTMDVNKTKLYLDVQYGIFKDRYVIKIPDTAGVSSQNSLIFMPNHVIKISGDYANINFGFSLLYTINLDDNSWDGLI